MKPIRPLTANILVCSVIVGISAFIIYPRFENANWIAKKYNCQPNLKQIALGLMQYSQDWDEKYPLVAVKNANINPENPYGWADALDVYLKSNGRLFWCPDKIRYGQRDGELKKPQDRDYTDYFFNRRLTGLKEEKLKNVALTVTMGDGNDGIDVANARYSLSELPHKWRTDKNSPSYRHKEGANYAFADGHVKWIKSGDVISESVGKGRFTFAVQ